MSRGHLFGQALREMRRVGEQHLAHAVELGGLLGDGATVLAGDENIDIAAEVARGRQRLGGRRRQRLVVVLGEQQDRHLQHPRLVLQLVDEAATLSTLMPASRAFGSATRDHLQPRRDVDAERLRRRLVDRLLLRLHDVREARRSAAR